MVTDIAIGPSGVALPPVGTVPAFSTGNTPDTYIGNSMYVVVCDGVPTGYGFVPAPRTASPAGTPATIRALAQSAAGSIAMPNVTINASPAVQGLVHMNTWFYAVGYSGGPISATRSALGATIEVDATPTSYTWDFGDGTPAVNTTSLGVAWRPQYTPDPSTVDCDFAGTPVRTTNPAIPGSVTHCYTATSHGFPVSVTFNLAVSYRVSGGPPIALAPIHRSAALTYPVEEINTVVTAR